MATNKIILKVVEHGNDTTKCRWGAFIDNTPLAEFDRENAIKSGRNVHIMALWAAEYAKKRGYKITQLIKDASEDDKLVELTNTAKELSAAKSKADKAATEKLNSLLSANDDNERKTLRQEWNDLLAIADMVGKDAKAASAAAIAASDEWFEKRKAATVKA